MTLFKTQSLQNLVQYEEKYWVEVVPYILKSINSLEIKLKAVLVLMDSAQVPWSQKLSNIFIEFLNYNHPFVDEIKNKIERYPALSILHKYRCSQSKKSDVSKQVEKKKNCSLIFIFLVVIFGGKNYLRKPTYHA